MVSDSGITKMAIHILGVTEQLGESLIMTIDDELVEKLISWVLVNRQEDIYYAKNVCQNPNFFQLSAILKITATWRPI